MEISVNGLSSERHILMPEPLLYVIGSTVAVNQDHPSEVAFCGNSI